MRSSHFEINQRIKKRRYLLGLVSEATGLIGPGGPGDANDGGELAIIPAPDPLKKPHRIRLLLPP